MAISINSIETLQQYLSGVLARAEHHAGNVEGVALALLGAIIWKADGEIQVRQYSGRPANMLWFQIRQRRFAMTYNHATEHIDLKDRTHQGEVLASFNNTTSYEDIIRVFNQLELMS